MRWLADENFKRAVFLGLRRRRPAIDIVRVQDTHLKGKPDPVLLEWAAQEGRLLLTHDFATMPHHAYRRLQRGLPTTGVVQADPGASVGLLIEHVLLMEDCGRPGEWDGQVIYLPFP